MTLFMPRYLIPIPAFPLKGKVRMAHREQSKLDLVRLQEGKLLERVAILGRAAAAHRESPGDFANVKVVLRVERETGGCCETAGRRLFRRAPAREDLAILVEDAHPRVTLIFPGNWTKALRGVAFVPREFRHIRPAQRVEDEMRGPLRVRPLAQVLAVRTEDLDAVALAVTH